MLPAYRLRMTEAGSVPSAPGPKLADRCRWLTAIAQPCQLRFTPGSSGRIRESLVRWGRLGEASLPTTRECARFFLVASRAVDHKPIGEANRCDLRH